jgi:hypothetical protein
MIQIITTRFIIIIIIIIIIIFLERTRYLKTDVRRRKLSLSDITSKLHTVATFLTVRL